MFDRLTSHLPQFDLSLLVGHVKRHTKTTQKLVLQDHLFDVRVRPDVRVRRLDPRARGLNCGPYLLQAHVSIGS